MSDYLKKITAIKEASRSSRVAGAAGPAPSRRQSTSRSRNWHALTPCAASYSPSPRLNSRTCDGFSNQAT